jgi:DNA uptake protein ComE-like DNA-binding protein
MKIFFAGLGFGVVAGLLLAPKRGELIRADLRDRAKRAIRVASDRIAARTSSRTPKKSPDSVASARVEERIEAGVHVLNTATRDALIAVHGIGEVLADRIIGNRPYETAYEVVEKGILPESTFVQLKRELLDKSA